MIIVHVPVKKLSFFLKYVNYLIKRFVKNQLQICLIEIIVIQLLKYSHLKKEIILRKIYYKNHSIFYLNSA